MARACRWPQRGAAILIHHTRFNVPGGMLPLSQPLAQRQRRAARRRHATPPDAESTPPLPQGADPHRPDSIPKLPSFFLASLAHLFLVLKHA